MTSRRSSFGLAAGVVALSFAGATASAQQEDPAQFYAGKTVRIVVGIAVGSGYDITARVVGRHIGNHIPGKPQVIVSNQPGAGSLTMTNALYASGPKDGTTIGASFNGMPTMPLLNPAAARFDATRINWVGSTNRESQVTYSWHSVPIKTIDDIRTKKFVVGSQAPGSSQNDFPVALNKIIGTQFSVVNGYESTAKIHLAMERGELHGVAAVNWSSLTSLAADWIRDKKINIVAQFALKPHPELPNVPMWIDQAKSPQDRQALQLLLSRLEFGRPYFLPPDVPASRVAAIRRAFDATMKDPAFLEEAKRMKLEISPLTGEQVAKLVAEVAATPPDIAARVREALQAK